MDFDKLAYPDKVVINGVEYEGRRDMSKDEVFVPYTDEPDVGIGDIITQKSGKREVCLKVLDASFLEECSLDVGTNHPHMLTLKVQNTTAQPHLQNQRSSTFNIESVTGSNVQVGDGNSLSVNISVQKLVEEVAESKDEEAKAKLRQVLNNPTVASVIGAGVSGLLGLL